MNANKGTYLILKLSFQKELEIFSTKIKKSAQRWSWSKLIFSNRCYVKTYFVDNITIKDRNKTVSLVNFSQENRHPTRCVKDYE